MSEPRARRSRWIFLIILALGLITGTTWFFNRSDSLASDPTQSVDSAKKPPSTPRPALVVTAQTPQRVRLAEQLAANGDIAAWQEASVGADVNGLRLAEVRVNIGDMVQKGQVLATFETEMVASEQAQARASLNEAEAALAEAASNATRALTIAPSGAMSKQQVNQYVTAAKTARARVAAARAALATQDLRLKYTQVIAPDAGVISARAATVGAVVGPGVELFRLVRRGRLEWRAEITAADLARLKPGLRAQITLPGDTEIAGTLRQLAPTVDPKTRYAIAYVDLPAGSSARAGMFARGSFELGQTEALTLPQEAIVMRDGFAHVLIIGADQRVTLTRVQTGQIKDDRIEIKEGLSADQRVAVRGAAFLNDGDRVQVVAADPASAATGAPALQKPQSAPGTTVIADR